MDENEIVWLLPTNYPNKKILHAPANLFTEFHFNSKLPLQIDSAKFGEFEAKAFKTKAELEEYLESKKTSQLNSLSRMIENLFNDQLKIMNQKPQYYEQ